MAYDTDGRQGISVAQPISGADYPLVEPSEDIRQLLADFYLGYTDDAAPFQPPFRISWLAGFDTVSSDSDSLAGAVDLIVVDADDRVVFDSSQTDPVNAASRDWGSRLRIYEWLQDAVICRVVVHTAWAETDTPQSYPAAWEPERAELDPSVVECWPQRLTHLVIGDQELTGLVEMASGYNIQIQTQAISGGHSLELSAIPGAGDGRFDACGPPDLFVRKISGVPPDAAGRFHFGASDCYGVRPPTSRSGNVAQQYANVFPGNLEDELPAENAGKSAAAAGWPSSREYAKLEFVNDCLPCIDCDDYVDFAQKMNALGAQYAEIGQAASELRDSYHATLQRWNDYLACSEDPGKLYVQPQPDGTVDVVMQFCNKGGECVHNLDLSAEVSVTPDGRVGGPVAGYTQIYGLTPIEGRQASAAEPYSMEGGGWPNYGAHWDTVQPGASAYLRFRLEFTPGAGDYAVTVNMAGTHSGGTVPAKSKTVTLRED